MRTSGPGPVCEYARRTILPERAWRLADSTVMSSVSVSGLRLLTMARAADVTGCAATTAAATDSAIAMLLERASELRKSQTPRLLQRRPSGFVLDSAVGAGREQRAKRGGVAEVDRRRVHQRREAVFVDRLDIHAGLCQFGNHVGAVRNRGPVQKIHAGAFDEVGFRACVNQRADH